MCYKDFESNVKIRYEKVVKYLMDDDKNGDWDMILEEYENNVFKAVDVVKSCLERIINEEFENDECDQKEHYKYALKWLTSPY